MHKTLHKSKSVSFSIFNTWVNARVLSILLILFGAAVSTSSAQVIGNWTFNNTLTGTPGTYNTASNSDFSSSIPTRSYNGGTEYYGENGWPSGSINTSMYLEFSLTPNSGYQLDISSIVLTMRRSNTGSPAGSGPTSWSIRSNLDGFASDIATGSMTLTYANYTINPGAAFTNRYTTVTFRVYGYNASIGSGGNSRMVFDNIRVNGIGYLLPSRIGSFAAVLTSQKVNLAYTVYQTNADDQYSIERSADGVGFSAIHSIAASVNAAEKTFTYLDDISHISGTTGQLYYRLRLFNSAGVSSYSPVSFVKLANTIGSFKVFAASHQLHISGNFPVAGSFQASIYSITGQQLQRFELKAVEGYNNFTYTFDKVSRGGIAVIKLENSKGFQSSTSFINN